MSEKWKWAPLFSFSPRGLPSILAMELAAIGPLAENPGEP